MQDYAVGSPVPQKAVMLMFERISAQYAKRRGSLPHLKFLQVLPWKSCLTLSYVPVHMALLVTLVT